MTDNSRLTAIIVFTIPLMDTNNMEELKNSTTLTPTLDPTNAGFTLTFDNGYNLSIRFGNATKCDNLTKENLEATENVEIAILNPEGGYAWIEGDILGYVPVDILPQLIVAVREGDEGMFKMFTDQVIITT